MMINVVLTCMILFVLSEGSGQWLFSRMHVSLKSYAAPAGAASLFALAELLYLPVSLLHLSSGWTKLMTAFIISAAALVTLMHRRETVQALVRPRSLYILSACTLAALILSHYSFHPIGNELALMKENASAASTNLADVPLQGYLLWGSMVMYYGLLDIRHLALTLTIFASGIGFMLVLNIIDSFQLKNPWFRFTLIAFSIFYSGFVGWRLGEGTAGSIWRLSLTALAIFTAYQWLKTGQEEIKKLIPLIMMAGLSASSGFLMISIEIIYCLMVYLLHIQKIRTLYDTLTFLIPVMLYLSAWLSRYSKAAGWILLAFYSILIIIRSWKKVYLRIIKAESFLIAYNFRIFYMIIPVVFLAGTFILRFFVPGYGIHYSYYITYFSRHYVSGFLFPKGNPIDIVIDIFRWGGLIAFLINCRTKQDKMVRNLFLTMLIFFVNPLCMGMLLEITGLDMYACAFEILFNPFTDILVFISIYRLFEWTVVGQWILELVLIFAALFGHITSAAGMNMGLYTDIIHPAAAGEASVYECL